MNPNPYGLVEVDDHEVRYVDRAGKRQCILRSNLLEVGILTTADGPFAEDVFFVLLGGNSKCVIPQSASGTDQLMTWFNQLPGFDFSEATKAMSCAEDAKFLCWRRP